MTDPATALVEEVFAGLRRHDWSIATAESLTGGLVVATLIDVAGASAFVRGGVTAYATDVKSSALGVDAELLGRAGAVDPEVARQMARGARRLLGADVGVATTGVAGPQPQDGRAVGTVFVAVATPDAERVAEFFLHGSRARIRREAVRAALRLCVAAL